MVVCQGQYCGVACLLAHLPGVDGQAYFKQHGEEGNPEGKLGTGRNCLRAGEEVIGRVHPIVFTPTQKMDTAVVTTKAPTISEAMLSSWLWP